MTSAAPLFQFAAAARAELICTIFPHRFYRAINILDHKTCLAFNNNFRDRTVMENE